MRHYFILVLFSIVILLFILILSFYSTEINKKFVLIEKFAKVIKKENKKLHEYEMKRLKTDDSNIKVSTSRTTIESKPVKTTKLILKPSLFPTTNVNLNFVFKTDVEAEEFYYKTITKNTINCSVHERVGRQDDGGWDVCLSGNFKLKNSNCLSYSFGVNYIWEFDDIISSKFGCIVRTFDPSMNSLPNEMQRPSKVWFYKIGLGNEDTRWSNGWQMMKMSSLLKKFNELDKVIDILKIDIEFSEWDSFESMLKEGLLSKVKQIMFETHTDNVRGHTSHIDSFTRFLRVWNGIYKAGFRQWKNSWNHFGQYTSVHSRKLRTCCFEHYLININFL